VPSPIDLGAERLLRWERHPAQMVREEFGAVPDAWQEKVLELFPHRQRIAMGCAKGPGKTTILAWLCWNFVLTRWQSNVGVTSISGQNLQDGLWKELAKWHGKSKLLQELFEVQSARIICKQYPKTWFVSARTWKQNANAEEQANTLAGFHADRILYLLDETGGMPEAVMASAEAAMTAGIDDNHEARMAQAGNTSKRSGPLYRASTSERGLWEWVRITGDPDDPERSPRIPLEWAKQEIARWGRNNAFVKVNVFAEFPDSDLNVLIGPEEMEAAGKRSYREHDIAYSSRLMGVDVAREGDDASVLFPRQGLVAFRPSMWRNIDGIQGAGHVSRKWQDWDADACFVDNTGGYGASWIDNLRLLGHRPVAVQFAGAPNDPRYLNKRAEIYWELVEWIKQGGQLPSDCPELTQALTQTMYTYNRDRLQLEDKEQLKARIGMSPDHADALAMTFAQPIGSRRPDRGMGRNRGYFKSSYDPYAIRQDEILR
jgi:phage terminase large subunit